MSGVGNKNNRKPHGVAWALRKTAGVAMQGRVELGVLAESLWDSPFCENPFLAEPDWGDAADNR